MEQKSVGTILKEERERNKIPLSSASISTGLSQSVLIKIENNEFYDLGTSYFVKNYLSSYASFLNINPNQIINLYHQQQESGRFLRKKMSTEKSFKIYKILIYLITFFVLFFMFFQVVCGNSWLVQKIVQKLPDQSINSKKTTEKTDKKPNPPKEKIEKVDLNPPQSNSIYKNYTLRTTGEVWIEVRDRDNIVIYRNKDSKDKIIDLPVADAPYELNVGRPANVKLFLDDQELKLLDYKKVNRNNIFILKEPDSNNDK